MTLVSWGGVQTLHPGAALLHGQEQRHRGGEQNDNGLEDQQHECWVRHVVTELRDHVLLFLESGRVTRVQAL